MIETCFCNEYFFIFRFLGEIDYIFSIGVIHHIPDAEIVCKKIYESLKPKGKFIIWLYGKEGNELYLFVFNNSFIHFS